MFIAAIAAACSPQADGKELADIRTELVAIRTELHSVREELRGLRSADAGPPAPEASSPTEPQAAEPVEHGAVSIQVESDPEGADVFVADEKIGVTPLAVPIPAGVGELRVRLEKEGYRPHLMNLRRGAGTKVSIELAKKGR